MKEYKTSSKYAWMVLLLFIIGSPLVFYFDRTPDLPSLYAGIVFGIIMGTLIFSHLRAKKFAIENDQLLFTQTFLSSIIPSVVRVINIKDIESIYYIQNRAERFKNWSYKREDFIIDFKIDGIKQKTKFQNHEFEKKTLHKMITEIMRINPKIKLDERILPYLSQ